MKNSSVEKVCVAPYDLIREKLIKEALKNEVGDEVEIISWNVEDFTKKGDNYSSLVTSILVKYKKNGNNLETSYVAKINPMRPASSFTDLLEGSYRREMIVLSEIVNGMNIALDKIDSSPIRVPKLFSLSSEKGKEVLLTEDLRRQGFRMHDKTKGMDIKHALLVMEELGRFHATSLLFEESLSPKTIPDSFDFEVWLDDSGIYSCFNALIGGQCRSACEMLNKVPKYENCVAWLNARIDHLAKLYSKSLSPSKKFNVLIHGDCWTNNILFKYDEEGNPNEIRFVDFQGSRKSSPACDLNYFFYSSLNGKVRLMYMNTMEITYYNSFTNILEAAGKQPTFTFQEFVEEVKKRKMFGMLSGMMILPVVLAEGNEIWDLNGLQDDKLQDFVKEQKEKFSFIAGRESGTFRDRFLSMFDEMIDSNIFDS